MNAAHLLQQLRSEKIETWFDLGIFLDRFRVSRRVPASTFSGDERVFREHLAQGVAFLSFYYAVDGVTVEVLKYARAMEHLLPNAKIHMVAGRIEDPARAQFDAAWGETVIDGGDGFDAWPLYNTFFHQRLERGDQTYNTLIVDFWADVLQLSEQLALLLQEKRIRLLFSVNIHSNPGNMALALATVLVCESLGVPVISNHHDFYWEGGDSHEQRQAMNKAPGPRDHFFRNAHLGEIFSLTQILYPWQSRSWVAANINRAQSRRLVNALGHNSANVATIGTAVARDSEPGPDTARDRRCMGQISVLLGGTEHTAVSRSVVEAKRSGAFEAGRRAPILVGARHQEVPLLRDTMMLLQPTRIIRRKCIACNFELIARLLQQPQFAALLASQTQLKLLLVVSGPVAAGQDGYLDQLVDRFAKMLACLSPAHRDRVHMAFLFSGFDAIDFCRTTAAPLTMADLYRLASLVLLPSENEGRGLPILESAAYRVPIFVRRYSPEEVYADLIGEGLGPDEQLRVIENRGEHVASEVVDRVADSLLHLEDTTATLEHNARVVASRFGWPALCSSLEEIVGRLHQQLRPPDEALQLAERALSQFADLRQRGAGELENLLNSAKRQYLAGTGQMGLMLNLASLIDPSSFRVEEQQLRGTAHAFALALWPDDEQRGEALRHRFFNAVDSLFLVQGEAVTIQHDHSFAYRHRGRLDYPYRALTPQQLTGVIALLLLEVRGHPLEPTQAPDTPNTDWSAGVGRLTGAATLAIDQRTELGLRLAGDKPRAIFCGARAAREIALLVVAPVRQRLGLSPSEPLTREEIERLPCAMAILVAPEVCFGAQLNARQLLSLCRKSSADLNTLVEAGLCQVVASGQLSVGVDFAQLGEKPLKALNRIRADQGFMVTCCPHAALMTDIADIERFHIGAVHTPVEAAVMGMGQGEGFVQWVPAALRATLGYPVPTQTAADLSAALDSEEFRALCRAQGKAEILSALRRDAEQNGSPVATTLAALSRRGSPHTTDQNESPVRWSHVNGRFADGNPWSGALASVRSDTTGIEYILRVSAKAPKTVVEFVDEFSREAATAPAIAWNGGYILNPELVGKLGLDESYIGSPLGLIVQAGEVLCPPLFNKPALLFDEHGGLEIKRVNAAGGLVVSGAGHRIAFDCYNQRDPGARAAYYDLLYPHRTLPGYGRVVYQLAGRTILRVNRTGPREEPAILPVGLSLSLPAGDAPDPWREGTDLHLRLCGLGGLEQAVEAGPLLLQQGQLSIDMPAEGWTTDNSIRTQAARIDYTDMRGPKIAVGLDEHGAISVLTVNGRIRESVGATHHDMAAILQARGIRSALGFDPGGSSTLVVHGKAINLSPYNENYPRNPYALPAQPRRVASAIIGTFISTNGD